LQKWYRGTDREENREKRASRKGEIETEKKEGVG
jgi:hypothetical protein